MVQLDNPGLSGKLTFTLLNMCFHCNNSKPEKSRIKCTWKKFKSYKDYVHVKIIVNKNVDVLLKTRCENIL